MRLFQTFDTRTDAMLAVKTMASSYGTKMVQRDVCFINREKREWKRLVLACEYFGTKHKKISRGANLKPQLGCPYRVNLNYRPKHRDVAVTLVMLTHNHEVPYVEPERASLPSLARKSSADVERRRKVDGEGSSRPSLQSSANKKRKSDVHVTAVMKDELSESSSNLPNGLESEKNSGDDAQENKGVSTVFGLDRAHGNSCSGQSSDEDGDEDAGTFSMFCFCACVLVSRAYDVFVLNAGTQQRSITICRSMVHRAT